jgi:hypothetical protein
MQRRQSLPRPTLSQLLVLAGVCTAVMLIVNLGERWVTCRTALADKQSLARLVEVQRARRDALQQRLDEVMRPEEVEKAIREEFGWIKDGEGSVILQDAGAQTSPAPAASAEEANTGAPPHWLDWLGAFFQP